MLQISRPWGAPVPLPILTAAVRAGLPSPADDSIEQELDLQRLLVPNRTSTFLVRVSGDSMVLARLFDGDIAVVDRSLSPADGDIVVADVDGERSFKIWSRSAGRIKLSFANPRFPEFEIGDDAVVEIWGVVSGSINPRRRASVR